MRTLPDVNWAAIANKGDIPCLKSICRKPPEIIAGMSIKLLRRKRCITRLSRRVIGGSRHLSVNMPAMADRRRPMP